MTDIESFVRSAFRRFKCQISSAAPRKPERDHLGHPRDHLNIRTKFRPVCDVIPVPSHRRARAMVYRAATDEAALSLPNGGNQSVAGLLAAIHPHSPQP